MSGSDGQAGRSLRWRPSLDDLPWMLLAGFTTTAFLGALWGFSDACAASNEMGCFLFGVVALFVAVPCAVVLAAWGLLVALGRSLRNSPRR